MFETFENTITKIQSACAMLASASMVLLIFLTVVETLFRYFLRSPLEWAIEFPAYLLTFSTALALGYTQKEKGHISVAILEEILSSRGRAVLNLCILPLYFFTVTFIGIAAFRLMWKSIAEWRLSDIMLVPLCIPQAFIFIGFILLDLQLILEFWKSFRSLRMPRQGFSDERGGV